MTGPHALADELVDERSAAFVAAIAAVGEIYAAAVAAPGDDECQI